MSSRRSASRIPCGCAASCACESSGLLGSGERVRPPPLKDSAGPRQLPPTRSRGPETALAASPRIGLGLRGWNRYTRPPPGGYGQCDQLCDQLDPIGAKTGQEKTPGKPWSLRGLGLGGAWRDRTADLRNAIAALSQL